MEDLPIISTKSLNNKHCKSCKVTRPGVFFITIDGKKMDECVYCVLDKVGELNHLIRSKKLILYDHIMEDKHYVYDSERDSFADLRNDIHEDVMFSKLSDEIKRHRQWGMFIKALYDNDIPFKIMITGKKIVTNKSGKKPLSRREAKEMLINYTSRNPKPETDADEVMKIVINEGVDFDISKFL